MCARCHSRRSQIHEDYVHGQPLSDDYRVALLDPGLYYPDGQIKAEDYEYGSFVQSRMFHAGVTCSDCHEPHSLKLRAPGNQLCSQCHRPGKYDSPAHHFHAAGAPGSYCVECHMPATLYMVIDARRDHSIRIPRPDLSITLGVPNACNRCHTDKSPQWASDTVRRWYGHVPGGFQRFAGALNTAWTGAPGAQQMLAQLIGDQEQPAIARASAIVQSDQQANAPPLPLMAKSTADRDSLVRRATARALESTAINESAPILSPLLRDPVRAVRLEAAQVMAGAPSGVLTLDDYSALRRSIDEYIAAQELNADRPEAHLNIALLLTRQKDFTGAQRQLGEALALDPAFTPAAINLADLYRQLGRDNEGERVLREAIAGSPDDASLQFALGLLLIRQGHKQSAVEHLAAAAKLDPANERAVYTYALALDDAGQDQAAVSVLRADVERYPFARDALAALASLLGKSGDRRDGLIYADRLVKLEPNDPDARELQAQLRAQPEKPQSQN